MATQMKSPNVNLSLSKSLSEVRGARGAGRADFAQALMAIAQGFQQAAQVLIGGPPSHRMALVPGQGQHLRTNFVQSPSGNPWVTVTELVNEFLLAKARAGRSDRYLRQLRVSLKSFTNGRARTNVEEINSNEVEKWLQSQEWAPKTSRGYLGDVKTLFNFGLRRGYLMRNPASGVELPSGCETQARIQLHSPPEVIQVLKVARRADLDVLRHLALRYFAGLRTSEAHRLRESDLKLEQGLLEVPAVKSKTRSRRLVTIQPNLRAWLALGGVLRPIGPDTIRRVIRLAGVPWAHNVTRHSFVSYHLARFESAARTALEAGHTEAMLFAHYRALVTPAAAKEFWELRPDTGRAPPER